MQKAVFFRAFGSLCEINLNGVKILAFWRKISEHKRDFWMLKLRVKIIWKESVIKWIYNCIYAIF